MLTSVADVDSLLLALQSPDNGTRGQAERMLDEYSLNAEFIIMLMTRTHAAPALTSRQLAASLLSWRMPRVWKQLGNDDRSRVQGALLTCMATCQEAAVLRILGEACNATCQQVAMHHDLLWEDLLRLLVSFLHGQSAIHRVAALELFVALVDSIGARLQQHYADLGQIVIKCLYDDEIGVRVASLAVIKAVTSSWCLGDDGIKHWEGAAAATLEVAAAALSRPSKDPAKGQLVVGSLRALGPVAAASKSKNLCLSAARIACSVLADTTLGRSAEHCHTQALQLLRALVRVPDGLDKQDVAGLVPLICRSAKDEAPDLDDINDVGIVAQAARDCVRVFVRVDPATTLPAVLEFAEKAMQSNDALDRAAAIHIVSYAFCGAREATPGWATLLVNALGDAAVWVRHAVCECAALLAETLRPDHVTTEGLLMLLAGFASYMPNETSPDVLKRAGDAVRGICRELSSDEIAAVLHGIVGALCSILALTMRGAASAESAEEVAAVLAALVGALGAAASAAADLFVPFAVDAAFGVLQMLRARCGADPNTGIPLQVLTPEVLSLCLDAAGSILASAWGEPAFRATREDLIALARRMLADGALPSNVRAGAHSFFGSMALASFEEFVPHLPYAVEAAVLSLHTADSEGGAASSGRRAVRTGAHEERVAAITSLGAYAVAVDSHFAVHLQTVVPAICAQIQHPDADVRAAVADSLERIGRMLGGLAEKLDGNSSDRVAAALMAQGLARSLRALIEGHSDGASALRRSLQAKEDLLECPGFVALLGQEIAAELSTAGGGKLAYDVESSLAEDDDDALEDD